MFLTDAAAETATEAVEVSWQQVLDKVIDWCTTSGIKLLIALVVMFLAFKVINFLTKKIYKRLQKRKVDETIARVSYGALKLTLKALVLICLVGYVGIETASLSAVVASLGVGISLAVQGTLSNFAGGVIIIIMRPFKIGDFITSNGESGTVEDIHLFYTHIVTGDNRVVMIPNGALANNVIVNNSTKETRRVDVIMNISYASDVDKAKQIIKDVCAANELIFKDPAPFVEVGNYGASSVDLFIRVWCKNGDYWTVNWYLLAQIRKELEANGIEIPFDQLEVSIKQQ